MLGVGLQIRIAHPIGIFIKRFRRSIKICRLERRRSAGRNFLGISEEEVSEIARRYKILVRNLDVE